MERIFLLPHFDSSAAPRIHDTLSGGLKPLEPLNPGHVRMYVCGMTVYDFCHVGHARVMIVFDMVVRYLRARGYAVTYVRNITDIDDKIIRRAKENGESIDALTTRFIAAMHEDERALAVLPPDQEPRATQHLGGIVEMIERLIENGIAYRTASGDVCYSVAKFGNYGQLSGKKLEDLRAGARVEIGEDKQDPLDFVLWKAAKPGEPAWPSPWGDGRPGWHIECSAMSTSCLGDTFDLHGGGQDLAFPHHENEIAQSEGATGERFVNLWMHNGFVRINDEKMSKSLGNFFTVREVLKLYAPEVLRLFILQSQYRSPLNYSDENLDASKAALERFYLALRGIDAEGVAPLPEYCERFVAVMDDDFNTPEAFAVLFELAREINRHRDDDVGQARALAATLKSLGEVLGILQADPEEYLRGGVGEAGLEDAEIDRLVAARTEAKAAKDYAEADRIRDELADQGVVLEDSAAGTTWRRG